MRAEVTTTREFTASADKVWAIAGDFGALDKWLPGITAIRVEGSGAFRDGGNAVRVIDLFDGSVTRERLEWAEPARYAYSYRILSAKGIDESANYVAIFTVVPTAGGCRVDWVAGFDMPDDFPAEKQERARQKISAMYGMCLQALEAVLGRG